MYKDSCSLLKDDGSNKVVKLITNDGAFFVHTDVHAVKLDNGYLRVYSYDSFINHSCEPNSTAVDEPTAALNSNTSSKNNRASSDSSIDDTAEQQEGETFTTIATRDIRSGEEITTDYDTFIYQYEGIPRCQCGSVLCRGHSFGFRAISPESVQMSLLPRLHPAVLAAWLGDRDHSPRVRYCSSQQLPPGLRLVVPPAATPSSSPMMTKSDSEEEERRGREEGLVLVAAQCFEAGAELCACSLVAVDTSRTDTVLFAVHNPWVLSQHAANVFVPLMGCDPPVMKLDITSREVPGSVQVCSLLDALAAAVCWRPIEATATASTATATAATAAAATTALRHNDSTSGIRSGSGSRGRVGDMASGRISTNCVVRY